MGEKYQNGVFGGVEINANAKANNIGKIYNIENKVEDNIQNNLNVNNTNIQNNISPEKQTTWSKLESILLKEIKFRK